MTRPAQDDGAGTLMADVFADVTRLIRGEVALAKAEVEESLREKARGVVLLVLAAVVALVALNVLAGTMVMIVVWLGATPVWASLIVGVVLVLATVGAAFYGMHLLGAKSLLPEKFLRNLRRDKQTFETAVKSDAT
jgi:uncharacterized membrane protein YqjE